MKKLKVLIPTLAITIGSCLTPSLVSCGNQEKRPSGILIKGSSDVYFGCSSAYKAMGVYGSKQKELKNIVWTINDPSLLGCMITENGYLIAGYQPGTVLVTASWFDPIEQDHVTSSMSVHLVSPITSVTINELTTKLHPNDPSYKFTATVNCAQGFSRDVEWEMINDGGTGSEIDSDGTFKCGNSQGEVTIQATSIFDPNKKDQYTFYLSNGPIIKFEVTSLYDSILTKNDSVAINVDLKVDSETQQGYDITFDAKATGATFNEQTQTVITENASQGDVFVTVRPKFASSTEYDIVHTIHIFDKFAEYYCYDNEGTAIVTSFNKDVGSCKEPILSVVGGCKVEKIQSLAFQNSKIENIPMPDTIKYIENSAFREAKSLKTLSFSDNSLLETIGSNAFADCFSLESFKIGKNLKEIEKYAFSNCQSLKVIDLSLTDKLTTLESSTFDDCDCLEKIILPKSLKLIKSSVFPSCEPLNEIYYTGTKEEWRQIEKEGGWDETIRPRILHCSDGDIFLHVD